jgi:plasmid stabilization system protein ParE
VAKIIWKDSATQSLEKHIDYALSEFGRKAVSNWYKHILRIESRMKIQPESFPPEPFLANRNKLYRSSVLMKHFKLIFYYEESNDTVYIDTIWDMRMHPDKLKRTL